MDDILKSIYKKCQESGAMIIFPSLLIWIAMYHLCPVEHKDFLELTRFHMWHFNSFSMGRTPLEQEEGKVLLEHWFQNLKIQTARWRVPQNIQRCPPSTTHIQLELDHTIVWHKQGSTTKAKPLDYYPTVEDIFTYLDRKVKTDIPIPEVAKENNQVIIEPLINQEKEEYYEFNLHISTLTSWDTPTEAQKPLQIENALTEQQAIT